MSPTARPSAVLSTAWIWPCRRSAASSFTGVIETGASQPRILTRRFAPSSNRRGGFAFGIEEWRLDYRGCHFLAHGFNGDFHLQFGSRLGVGCIHAGQGNHLLKNR